MIEQKVVVKRGIGRPKGSYVNKYPTINPDGSRTRTWGIYMGMKQRCSNPKSTAWKYYGGRGIKVCDRWAGYKGFDNFFEDMGECPAGFSIDRYPDGNGNYEKSNCRWATVPQQIETRRSTKGQVRDKNSLRQRAIRAGLDYRVVVNRTYYLGWSEERALSTPKLPRGGQPGRRRQGDNGLT